MRPRVSIIILCHNDASYLERCEKSIRRWTKISYELILIDNASPDGAVEVFSKIMRSSPAPVKIVKNKSNRFFSGGNNQGMRIARGEYLLLLNADTVVTPGWLESMVAAAEGDPSIGLVAPYTNQAAGFQVLWPPGYRSLAELPAWARRFSRKHRGRIRFVSWVTAFCLLIPRHVYQAIGGLDESFGPGGFEDYDYCNRAHSAGFRIVISEGSYVHHYGGRGYVNMGYDDLRARNREILWSTWSGRVLRALGGLRVG